MAEEEKKEEQTEPEKQGDKTEEVSPEEADRIREALSTVPNIDRVLDIDLHGRVQIGTLEMKLKNILRLHPGVILEVEKNADSLLTLKIGNKIIAHGEVGLAIRKYPKPSARSK